MSYRNITINAINNEVATNPSALPQIITALSERMAYNKAKQTSSTASSTPDTQLIRKRRWRRARRPVTT